MHWWTKGLTATETKFLGLIIDDTLSWSQHIYYIINKLSVAYYAIRNIKHTVTTETLRLISFAHVHSIISYGIIFWGSASLAQKVFIMQKRIIRVIMNMRPRDSCREIFKRMKIMTLYSQYIYMHYFYLWLIIKTYLRTIMNYMITKLGYVKTCTYMNLAKFDKHVFIAGVRVFNHLPHSIKRLVNDEKGLNPL